MAATGGMDGGYIYFPIFCAPNTDKQHVRCCSESVQDPFEDGWWRKHEQCSVWGAAKRMTQGGAACAGKMTFPDAEDYCRSVGVMNHDPTARLCTVKEMHLGCTDKTGCKTNTKHMWTSDINS